MSVRVTIVNSMRTPFAYTYRPNDSVSALSNHYIHLRILTDFQRMILDLHILHGTARFKLKSEVHAPSSGTPKNGTLTEKYLIINETFDPMVLHVPTGRLYHLPPADFVSVIMHMFFLSSHTTHSHLCSNNDQRSSSYDTKTMTFFAPIDKDGQYQVGLLDIVLEHPVEGSMTVSWTPGSDEKTDDFTFTLGTMQGGRARIIASTDWDEENLPEFTAYTVNTVEGDRVIMATDVQIGYKVRAWDGLGRRVCRFISDRCVGIDDYV
jgi:hypothetical protein